MKVLKNLFYLGIILLISSLMFVYFVNFDKNQEETKQFLYLTIYLFISFPSYLLGMVNLLIEFIKRKRYLFITGLVIQAIITYFVWEYNTEIIYAFIFINLFITLLISKIKSIKTEVLFIAFSVVCILIMNRLFQNITPLTNRKEPERTIELFCYKPKNVTLPPACYEPFIGNPDNL